AKPEIADLFCGALELASPAERAGYLERVRHGGASNGSWRPTQRKLKETRTIAPEGGVTEGSYPRLLIFSQHEHTRYCHVYGFHDLRRAFATMNTDKLTLDALQVLMRHKSYTTTQKYINMARQMDAAVASLQVPEVLRIASRVSADSYAEETHSLKEAE